MRSPQVLVLIQEKRLMKSEKESESEVKKKKRYHFRNALFFLVAGTRISLKLCFSGLT